ncbi:MAG: hypothetical protein QOC77_414 [Thermoleophilaceae bacterium]|nr:hypothetical protein [Thermoleophilaceae bacterium]
MSSERDETSVTLLDDGDKPVVRFERWFPYPVERLWEALTDEAELAAWYPTAVVMGPVAGGLITFTFPGGTTFAGTVLEAERPHLLSFTTRDDVLRWELDPAGDGTRLVLFNTAADPAHVPYTAAGFHISLNQLGDLLSGGQGAVSRVEMPPPQDLVEHYAAALGPQRRRSARPVDRGRR